MSKYTTELRYILESEFDLGMNLYPIISEDYRILLNQKIYNHYYFHEIGFETASLFKHYLNSSMEEKMPYFNQLLQSQLLEINPLLSFQRSITSNKNIDSNTVEDLSNNVSKNVDDTTTQNIINTTILENTTINVTDETQSKNTDIIQATALASNKTTIIENALNDKDIFSDTPQSLITDINLNDNLYATTANIKTNTSSTNDEEILGSTENINKGEDSINIIDSDTTNTTNTNTSSNTENITGYGSIETILNENDNIKTVGVIETNVITENGFEIPLAELLLKYRETFLNIDILIIDELKDLFMLIY